MNADFTDPRTVFVRLLHDERGQDLVEYALLTGIVVVVAALGVPAAAELGDIYQSWVTGISELWEPPPPSGS